METFVTIKCTPDDLRLLRDAVEIQRDRLNMALLNTDSEMSQTRRFEIEGEMRALTALLDKL
jgi:hypothetical protein